MIQTKYLQEIASYTNNLIAKVTLNGQYDITTFTVKRVSDQRIELEYLIPAADITSINLLELRSATNEVLGSSDVFIPIAADTVIKQYVEVKGA
ncbi:ketopantoate hydroxymethyltransferase [Paenibacillus wenxiniae]|uniref:Ketopantoate hydroxymethyltransferase n=1 Tax=Paenibacillus wenxiniae TaxID=1636843 RepID=A0ABW4RIN4_9BACL